MLDQHGSNPIAEIKNLRVEFETKDGTVVGVEDVSFSVGPGETVCVVGESGSGKSVSSLSLMRLGEFGGGTIAGGKLAVLVMRDGEDARTMSHCVHNAYARCAKLTILHCTLLVLLDQYY